MEKSEPSAPVPPKWVENVIKAFNEQGGINFDINIEEAISHKAVGRTTAFRHCFSKKITQDPCTEELKRLNSIVLEKPISDLILSYLKADNLEAADFFEGFSEQLRLDDGSLFGSMPVSSKMPLLMKMTSYWPKIQKLGYRNRIYDFLCGELGQDVVGKPDAFDKLCKRYGIPS